MALNVIFINQQKPASQEMITFYPPGDNFLCKKDAVCCRLWKSLSWEWLCVAAWCGFVALSGIVIIILGSIVSSNGTGPVMVGSGLLIIALMAACVGVACLLRERSIPQPARV